MYELSISGDELMKYASKEITKAYARLAIDKLMPEALGPGKEFNSFALFQALNTKGKKSTACVSIPRRRKSDGTFESKFDQDFSEYPHVVYAKIWRWPDVLKEELKHRDSCTFGFDLNKEFICVNPYHYDRIESIPKDMESSSTSNVVQSQMKTDKSANVLFWELDAGTNSTQNASKIPDVLFSDPGSEKESNLCALLSAMSSEGGSAKDDYLGRESDTLSLSTSSDDDFEIIDYDTDLKKETDGTPPKNKSAFSSVQSSPTTKDKSVEEKLACLKVTDTEPEMFSSLQSSPAAKDKSIEEELASLKVTDTEPEMKPLITAARNVLEESESPKKNTMDEDNDDKRFENSHGIAEPAVGKIIVCENNDEWKKKYEQLQMKHEKLKTTFVEMGFAANDPANETPYKDVLKSMNDVKDDFLGDSTSSKQYCFLKAFLESCTVISESNCSSGSLSSTNTPYHRKFKPNWMSSTRKKTFTSALSVALTANKTESGASASCSKISPVFTFAPSPKPSCSGNLLNNSFGWDPREPIPTVMIEHRPKSAPSNVQEQQKTNDVNQELNCNDQVSKDDAYKDQMMEEITTLRNQVKNLETQLEVQKQNEFEKMALYTNSLRDQYIKTVSGLIEENKVLSERIAKQESQVTAHALEIPRLLDEKDREIDILNENLLKLSAILTKSEEKIQTLKKEKRKLKRNSESEEADEEISSKIRRNSESDAETNDEPSPLHPYAFDSVLVQLKKCLENTSSNNVVSEEHILPNNVLNEDDLPQSPKSQQIALSTKLSDLTTELEEMKITHDKTKSDLEAKLKIGAKKYAQLYLKYDRMVKNCQAQN